MTEIARTGNGDYTTERSWKPSVTSTTSAAGSPASSRACRPTSDRRKP